MSQISNAFVQVLMASAYSLMRSNQFGVSSYKDEFRQRSNSGEHANRQPNRLRRNRPHPHKDFLLPTHIDDGIELQKRVRRAVREYFDEIYSKHSDSKGSSPLRPPQFRPPTNDDDLQPRKILSPQISEQYFRSRPTRNETYRRQLEITGRPIAQQDKPSPTVAVERFPPTELEGETKRDRSIRIRQEIEQNNRVPTPTPQPKKWQRVKSAVPPKPKPSFARPTHSKRVYSAPPATEGYTYYTQAKMNTSKKDTYSPMQDRLKAWADTANDYEKQVVYDLLNRAAQPREGPPSTPPSPQEAYHLLYRAGNGPTETITSLDKSSDKKSTWSPYFNDLRRKQTKQRNLNSAPIKPMLGLVPSASQYPQRDQRSFRLKGQDHRVQGNPADEREMKEYLRNVAKVTQKTFRQPDKKILFAPMHTYPSDKRGDDSNDYKCDVSFFQSVRAPFKSHFVIHPDFTSENFIQKRHANQMVSHIRY